MFLLNSWLNQFTETIRRWYALSRSYSVNLPSSFSTAHPSALEYSSHPPVSVCGTGCFYHNLEVFLGGLIRVTISAAEAFSGITPTLPAKSLREIIQQPVDTWKNELVNDFEKSIILQNN